MMGTSGLVIGAILGVFNARGARKTGRPGGTVAARAVFGGLMFGTLLFGSSFIFHCVLDGPPMTYSRPPEGNIFLQHPPQRPYNPFPSDSSEDD